MPTLTPSSDTVAIYEIAVLYPHPLTQKEEALLQKEVESIFQDAEGKQVAKDVWGRRGLAYPVEGHVNGTFIIYHYELQPTKVREVDHALHILPGLLRHMIIKPPKGYQIVKYSEQYAQWMKERESVEEVRSREREESLQRKVAEKAKRQAKRVEAKKKEGGEEQKVVTKEEISKELDKLISDDDIAL